MSIFRSLIGDITRSSRSRQHKDATIEDGPELIIVVMGSTGTGKSTLINYMTGDEESAHVEDGLTSDTSDIKVTPWVFARRRVKLVDTPGFDDSKLSDTAVLKKIADFLQASFGRQVYVNAIIYLHRIIDPRMTGTAMKNLQLLQDICGDNMRNVLLVTTFWDMVPPKVGERREEELATNFWKPLLDLGSRMLRYRYQTSGEELMWDILRHQGDMIELQLQVELTDTDRALQDTTAGWRIQEGLNHQLEQLGLTLNQVQEEQLALRKRKGASKASEKSRVTARGDRTREEIAAIERDLEILREPRIHAMEEINNRVEEIMSEKGIDEIDAFWDLYHDAEDGEDGEDGEDDEDEAEMDKTTPSFHTSRGQPMSQMESQTSYANEQFGQRSKPYKQGKQKETRDTNYGGRDRPEAEAGLNFRGYNNQERMGSAYTTAGYGGQQSSSGYNTEGYDDSQYRTEVDSSTYGNQQMRSRYSTGTYDDHDPQYSAGIESITYGVQQMGTGGKASGYGEQQGRGSRKGDYGNTGYKAGESGKQNRKDTRGY